MSAFRCRSCKFLLAHQPIFNLHGMPASAQGFLTHNELKDDRPTDLRIYQCSACGLVQADCEPVSYYREVIRSTAYSQEMKDFRKKFLGDFVESNNLKGKSILEIGCGRGEYLDLMSGAGLIPSGTEYGSASWQHCRDAGHHVQRCFPDDPSMKLDGGPFDAFASFNFLEHWPDPASVFQTIYSNTTADAIGLLEVPNFDMILRKCLFSEFISDHLSYFTEQSFRLLLCLNGFEVIDCNAIWHEYILSAVVRKRQTISMDMFTESRVILERNIKAFLAKHSKGGVAIWGAGHQALAAISVLGISNHIKYIIDSAPFKQGRYTPASHIPIHAPSHLVVDPVSAVVIIAAGFSDEISQTLRRNFDPGMELAILRETTLEPV